MTNDSNTRKALENLVQEQSLLLANTPALLFSTDEQGIIVAYGGPEEELFMPPSEFLGRGVRDILPGNVAQVIEEGMLEAKGNSIIEKEYFVDLEEETRWYSLRIRHKESRFFFTVDDITSHKQVEEQALSLEDTMKQYLSLAEELFVALDTEGIVTLANRKTHEILGSQDVVGRNWFDNYIPQRTREETYAVFRGVLEEKTQRFGFIEGPVITRSGEERIISWHNTALRGQGGTTIGSLSSGRDVTEAKQSEEALRSSKATLSSYISHSPYGVFVANQEGRYIDINPAACHMLGYTREELLRLGVGDIVAQKSLADTLHSFENLVASGEASVELTAKRKDGSEFPMSVKANKISDESYIGFTEDLTAREAYMKRIISQERLSAIGETARGVAHDFNNALQFIMLRAESALQNDVSRAVQEDLEEIKEHVAIAGSRIQQLQRYAKQQDDSPREYQVIDLDSVVQESIAQTRSMWKDTAQSKGLRIDVHYSGDDNLYVKGLPRELQSAFFNMIKNSVEAMPAGGIIDIRAHRNNDRVRVTVQDTGVGMNEETQKRLFEPYSTKGIGNERGFGMMSVYRTMHEHGGRVEVLSSTPGHGTTIQLDLPYANESPATREPVVPSSDERLRILLVDDEDAIRNLGQRILSHLNHEADVAENGREALDMLTRKEYDLIISDIGMPEMNGWQLAEQVRDLYEMPVTLASGWSVSETPEELLRKGVKYFLSKPYDVKQLTDIITSVINNKKE